MPIRISLLLSCALGFFVQVADAAEGRLIATGGASSIEGSAGGGITPWAVLAGYGEKGEWGSSVFATHVDLPDYKLDVAGLAFAYDNRVEVSYAHQRFDLGTLVHKLSLPDDNLSQDIFGMKVRLFGDLIYDTLPQVSAGLEYKHQNDFLIPSLVGARRNADTEGYVTASRLFMGAAFGYNLLVNGGLRYSRANETSLLGFGGDLRDTRSVLKEGSVAVLFNPRWALVWSTGRSQATCRFPKKAIGRTCSWGISPISTCPLCWPMPVLGKSPRWITRTVRTFPLRGASEHASAALCPDRPAGGLRPATSCPAQGRQP